MQIQVNTDRHIQGSASLTDEVESIVQHALSHYDDRITRVEVFLSDENSSQKSGDSDKRCVIEARLGGLQPVTVSHRGASLDQAVNGAADKMEKTLKRTVRRRDSLKRRVQERAAYSGASPQLLQYVESGKRDEFVNELRPLLGNLGQHARRELRIMEANGILNPGEVVYSHLLDEMVTRAWLQFADRPQGIELDAWLTKILDEILDETTRADAQRPASLVDQAGGISRQGSPQVDDQEWWAWLLGADDTVSDEDTIASGQEAWAEGFLAAEELMHRVHAVLGELPKLQRRAFVLHVFEAYETVEIAMIQDRPEKDVQSDIEAARNQLRERLRPGTGSQASR